MGAVPVLSITLPADGVCRTNAGQDFLGVFVAAVREVTSSLGVAKQLVQQLGLLVLVSLGTTHGGYISGSGSHTSVAVGI